MNAATTVQINACTSSLDLYRQYQGESEPQPAHIAIDLEDGIMWATYDATVGSGTPEEVYNRRERWYGIPILTGDAANALMRRLAPLAERVLAGSTIEFNDNGNRVGVLNEDAQAASAAIEEQLGDPAEWEQTFAEEDLVAVWDIDGATNGDEAKEYGITSATTDARLDEIAAQIEKDMANCGGGTVAVVNGLGGYLYGLRGDLLEQDKAVYWSVMGAPSPDADAVQPELAGITVPDAVLDWAAGHGLSLDDPDVYLLVAPTEGAQSLDGEIAFMEGALSDTDAAALRTALDAQTADRAEDAPTTTP